MSAPQRFLVRDVTNHPELGKGLFSNQRVPKKSTIPYSPSVYNVIDNTVTKGMLSFGIFEYLLELAIGDNFNQYSTNINLKVKDQSHNLFMDPLRERNLPATSLPTNWNRVFTADILFPFQTKLLKGFGAEVAPKILSNYCIHWRNLLSSMDNVCFAPFTADGKMNQEQACYVNDYHHFNKGEAYGKPNARFSSNGFTGEISVETTHVIEKGEQVFVDYKYMDNQIFNTSWRQDALNNILVLVKDASICEYGYDMGMEYWKCGLAFVWWLNDSNIVINKQNVGDALEVLLTKSHPFMVDTFARHYLSLLLPMYPDKKDTILGIVNRSKEASIVATTTRPRAPSLHPDILNLKVGHIICVFAYWNFDETTQRQIYDSVPLYCTVVVNYVWGQSKNRLINGVCIDNFFPESYGKTILLHGANKEGNSRFLGHEIKFQGRKGNRISTDASGRRCYNYFFNRDTYMYNKTETRFPLRLCEEVDDKKAAQNLVAISKIEKAIKSIKVGDPLLSIEKLVGWNGLRQTIWTEQETLALVTNDIFENVMTKKVDVAQAAAIKYNNSNLLKKQNVQSIQKAWRRLLEQFETQSRHNGMCGNFIQKCRVSCFRTKLLKAHTSYYWNGKTHTLDGAKEITYTGQMKGCKRYGQGTLVTRTGCGVYTTTGKFKNNLPHGNVKMTIPTGKLANQCRATYFTYEGSISINTTNVVSFCKGTVTCAKNNNHVVSIDAQWKKQCPVGIVTATTKTDTGSQTYKGFIVPNTHVCTLLSKGFTKHGKGTYTQVAGGKSMCLKGNFVNNFACGKVTQRFFSGQTYNGTMVNGLAHGQGKANLLEEGTYVGQWVSGLRHGFGILYTTSDVKQGTWTCGKLAKKHAFQEYNQLTAHVMLEKKSNSANWGLDLKENDKIIDIVFSKGERLSNALVKGYVGRYPTEVSRKMFLKDPLAKWSTLIGVHDMSGARYLDCTTASLENVRRFMVTGKGNMLLRVVLPVYSLKRKQTHVPSSSLPTTKRKKSSGEKHIMVELIYEGKPTLYKVKYKQTFQKMMKHFLQHILKVPEKAWEAYYLAYDEKIVATQQTPEELCMPLGTAESDFVKIQLNKGLIL